MLEYRASASLYILDTIAMSTSSAVGAATAISRGLHPLVCCVSGVTSCFGGILRDVICQREIALGSQSFAASTAAGAAVYVGLREACLRGFALPLIVRLALSCGSVVAVRVADYVRAEP